MARRDRKESTGSRKIIDFGWVTDGRLRQALDETTSASLLAATYTGDGERVTKTDVPSGGHVYSYGLFDSNASTWYTPGRSQRKGISGADRFFHQDAQGSTRYLTDSNGAAPAALRYDAYGNRSASAGTDPAHPTDFQYAGAWGYEREADTTLGLDYLSQRYYDPAVGRFITRDPIGWAGGLNLYRYCGNDPVNGVDPLGLAPVEQPLIWQLQEGLSGGYDALQNLINNGIVWDPRRWPANVRRNLRNYRGILEALSQSAADKILGFSAEGGGNKGGTPCPKAEKGIRSLQKQIEEHTKKLADYTANPDAYDNQGLLRNAASQEIRERIIQGRIRHLEREIEKFANEIRKLQGSM